MEGLLRSFTSNINTSIAQLPPIPGFSYPRGPATTRAAADAYVAAVAQQCRAVHHNFVRAPTTLAPDEHATAVENARIALDRVGSELINDLLPYWFSPSWIETCAPWFGEVFRAEAARRQAEEDADADVLSLLFQDDFDDAPASATSPRVETSPERDVGAEVQEREESEHGQDEGEDQNRVTERQTPGTFPPPPLLVVGLIPPQKSLQLLLIQTTLLVPLLIHRVRLRQTPQMTPSPRLPPWNQFPPSSPRLTTPLESAARLPPVVPSPNANPSLRRLPS